MTLKEILLEGKAILGVQVGIISRIEKEQYHVYAVESEYANINTGDIFDLEKTYCRDVITNNKTMIFDDVAEISELLKHPCYLNTQLRAYIGTPLILDNQIWGTLNFSSLRPKQPAFTHQDFSTIESLAQRAVKIINAQDEAEIAKQMPVTMSK